MITIFLNIIILSACAKDGGDGSILAIAFLVFWDLIVFLSIKSVKNKNNKHYKQTDYNEGYHNVDYDNNGKIDWYEM